MNIQQEPPPFTPITITLATREEAEAMWTVMDNARGMFHPDSASGEITEAICRWFDGRIIT